MPAETTKEVMNREKMAESQAVYPPVLNGIENSCSRTRDASYKGLAAAIAELIDNSIRTPFGQHYDLVGVHDLTTATL